MDSSTTEWVTFDVDGHLWTFDIGFMLSSYECQFGRGTCPGAFGNGGSGCCDIGFTFEESERAEIQSYVDRLTPADWDNHDQWHDKKWWRKREGSLNSKTVDDSGQRLDDEPWQKQACVFNNVRSGTGCAFHKAANERGESYIKWKPNTCWQVPILMETSELETVIRPMLNYDWGDGEHEPLKWWCIEEGAAYNADKAVYRSLKDELVELVGAKVYARLLTHLGAMTPFIAAQHVDYTWDAPVFVKLTAKPKKSG